MIANKEGTDKERGAADDRDERIGRFIVVNVAGLTRGRDGPLGLAELAGLGGEVGLFAGILRRVGRRGLQRLRLVGVAGLRIYRPVDLRAAFNAKDGVVGQSCASFFTVDHHNHLLKI